MRPGSRSHFGRLDVVAANVGMARIGTVRARPAEEFEWVTEVNLLGVYRTLRPAIEPVVERRGHLLAVSPVAATVAWRESAGLKGAPTPGHHHQARRRGSAASRAGRCGCVKT